MIYVGVGGWNFAPWRGLFYPRGLVQARELSYMSGVLNSLEINSTFYGTQKPATFQRWHDDTPADFVFSVKGPMFVTNRRDLAQSGNGVSRFLDSGVVNLGSKLGPINWQLSPGKQFVSSEIDAFLSQLPTSIQGRTLRHAIEVRHASFATAEFVQLAAKHHVAIVIAGDSEYPQIADQTAAFAYLRIMGTTDARPRGYAPAALRQWAQRARALAESKLAPGLTALAAGISPKAGARDVFLYVISGAKQRNPAAAQALLELLRD